MWRVIRHWALYWAIFILVLLGFGIFGGLLGCKSKKPFIQPTIVLKCDSLTAVRLLHESGFRLADWHTDNICADRDSLREQVRKLLYDKFLANNGEFVYHDSAIQIKTRKRPGGQMAVAFKVAAPDSVRVTDTVYVNVNKPVRVKAPCYTYFWLWGLVLLLVLETALFVRHWRKYSPRFQGLTSRQPNNDLMP